MIPVTFGVEEIHSAAITFHIFVKASNRESLFFYDIMTVPVFFINDLTEIVNIYSIVALLKIIIFNYVLKVSYSLTFPRISLGIIVRLSMTSTLK